MRAYVFSRRNLFGLAAAARGIRLYAASSEFWDKKPPSEWTSDEIGKLTTRSPWAKPVTAQLSSGQRGGGRGGMGGGGMGGPGIGIPGMGGPHMGGGGMGRGRGGQMQQAKGTVRWESAQTMLDATKTPLPEAFANHYAISVSGFPLRGRRQEDDSGETSGSRDDMLENLKSYTSLQPKGKPIAQPGVVQLQPSRGSGSILFGFSREVLDLSADDKEVTFSTQLGRALIRTNFELKDMTYHGKLAL